MIGGLNYLDEDLDGIAGRSSGVVNVAVDVHVPVLAVGVTRKLTTAIAVPIVNYQSNIDTGSVAYSNLNYVADYYTRDGEGDVVTDAETKFLNAVNEKLAQYNYSPIENKRPPYWPILNWSISTNFPISETMPWPCLTL